MRADWERDARLGGLSYATVGTPADRERVREALAGGAISGVVGLGMGYLTLRLRGVFFAIATLALAVVVQTLITNWDFVGGSRGAYVIPPNEIPFFGPYIQYLFVLMLVLVIISLTCARLIERSRLGYGFATSRANMMGPGRHLLN